MTARGLIPAGYWRRRFVRALSRRMRPASMEREDLLGLLFSSGLSTHPLITDISGRGLGLAIVREKVEKLGGR